MRKILIRIPAIQINSTKKPTSPLFLLFFQKASVRFRFVPFGKRQSFVQIGTGIKCTRAGEGKKLSSENFPGNGDKEYKGV